MKTRKICLIAAATLMVAMGGVALASSGTQEESLISQSYLEESFLESLTQNIRDLAENLFAPTYQQAEDKLDSLAEGYLSGLGAGGVSVPSGWSSSDQFTPQDGEAGDSVTLMEGSGIFWSSGSAVSDGILVDITQGTELATGEPLQVNHRYLAVEQVSITVSTSASWSVEGIWRPGEGTSVTELPFTDVAVGSWYYDAVRYVYENELYLGTSDTTFSPSETMERKMITTVLYRFHGNPSVEYAPLFSDVPDGVWYADGTVWAGENGIVSGVGNQLFAPDDPVVRQQIAVILYNYACYIGADTSARGDLSGFADREEISTWAQDAVSWAVSVGILQGAGGRVFPGEDATRAEVAIMLQRFDSWLN